MALALFFVGLLLVVSAVKGTQGQLSALFASEFTGSGNFWAFIAGIIFLGSLGYIPALRNTSRALIALTLIVLVLSNGGFWQQLSSAVQNPKAIEAPPIQKVPDAVDIQETGKTIGKGVASGIAGLAADNIVGAAGGGAAGGLFGKVIGGVIGALF